MIIAYGGGRNGKSTFWNAIRDVLGDYGGNLSADVFTKECRRNTKPEIAELRGKRMVIAAELETGTTLSTSTVKHLTSTDDIIGEQKYKAPFSFKPSHTIVMYTNNLPTVNAVDDGTWRRLLVIPFNARITGQNDVKGFGEKLVKDAGGAILKWLIDGAAAAYAQDYRVDPPACVQHAVSEYRQDADSVTAFLNACCVLGAANESPAGKLQIAYQQFCTDNGYLPLKRQDLSAALVSKGYPVRRKKTGVFYIGVALIAEHPV